jgi:hypothetical protein
MSLTHSPTLANTGLVICFDPGNNRSFIPAPNTTTWINIVNPFQTINVGNNISADLRLISNNCYLSANSGGTFVFANNQITGVNQYITTTGIPDSFWQGSYTISAWAYFNQVNKQGRVPTGGNDWPNTLIAHGQGVTDSSFSIGERFGKLNFGFYNDDFNSATTLLPNTWYNLVGTYDSSTSTRTMYINTIYDSSKSGGAYIGTGNNTVIASATNSYYQLFGQLGRIDIYNRVLTPTEIQRYYLTNKGRYGL